MPYFPFRVFQGKSNRLFRSASHPPLAHPPLARVSPNISQVPDLVTIADINVKTTHLETVPENQVLI